MALNRYMHKRNIFKGKRIDFKELSSKYDFVRNALCSDDNNDEIVVDFKSPAHLSVISKALLLNSFNLDVIIPLDRLIPTIPLRLNYILWIEDLLKNSSLQIKSEIQVLDIGAGAVCVYGLLGARMNKWKFVATEIDLSNINTAQINIKKNNLEDLIEVVGVSPDNGDGSILVSAFQVMNQEKYFDIVMCNPPFFSNATDKSGGNTTKNEEDRDVPKSVNTANRTESVVVGGEIQFTQRLIDESVTYKNQIGIFTVMLGKKCSSEAIKHYLQSKNISNHSVYEMCQGRVMRWGVAWSFLEPFTHPKSEFQLSKQLHTKCTMSWKIPCDTLGLQEYSVNGVYDMLRKVCKTLDVAFLEQRNKQSEGGGYHLLVTARSNTWSHQRRKRRELLREKKEKTELEVEEPHCKRRRIEDVCEEGGAMDANDSVTSSNTEESDCLLRCTMNVATIFEQDLPLLQLDLTFIDGNKEAMNQILTFIKNFAQKPL